MMNENSIHLSSYIKIANDILQGFMKLHLIIPEASPRIVNKVLYLAGMGSEHGRNIYEIYVYMGLIISCNYVNINSLNIINIYK